MSCQSRGGIAGTNNGGGGANGGDANIDGSPGTGAGICGAVTVGTSASGNCSSSVMIGGASTPTTIAGALLAVKQSLSFSSTPAFNPNAGAAIQMTLIANLGVWGALSPGSDGQQFELTLTQDGTGSRTIGTPPSNIVWLPTTYLGSTHPVPTLTTTANKSDVFYFRYNTT